MKSLETEAIVLRTRDWGESDRIVTFYTLESGKMVGLAKGARRSRKRFVNVFETAARVQVTFRLRNKLDWIDSCRLLDPATELRTEIDRWSLAFLACEMVEKTAPEGDKNPFVFDLLRHLVRRLPRDVHPLNPVVLFLLSYFHMMGQVPAMEGCRRCERSIKDVPSWIWNVDSGDILCASHRIHHRLSVEMDVGTVRLIQQVQRSTPEKLWRFRLRRTQARSLFLVMVSWVEEQLGRPLRSRKVVESVLFELESRR